VHQPRFDLLVFFNQCFGFFYGLVDGLEDFGDFFLFWKLVKIK